MRNADAMVPLYEGLADRFSRQNEPRQRDQCLVLAADAALSAGQSAEAERLRQRLLQANPHHLLRPFASMAEAMQAPDVQEYVIDLRRQWPPDFAQRLNASSEKSTASESLSAVPGWAVPPSAVAPSAVAPSVVGPSAVAPSAVLRPAAPVERPAPAKPAQAMQAVTIPLEAPPARKPAAAPVPTARPAAPPPRSPLKEAAMAQAAADAAASTGNALVAWTLLLLAVAGGLGLLFLTFVWPLLE